MILIIYDRPDKEDRVLQKPFVSPAGKLLRQIVSETIDHYHLPFWALYNENADGTYNTEASAKCVRKLGPHVVITMGEINNPQNLAEFNQMHCQFHPRQVLEDLDQRDADKRYISIKNTFLQACHSLMESSGVDHSSRESEDQASVSS